MPALRAVDQADRSVGEEHFLLPAFDASLPLEELIRRLCACKVKSQMDSFSPPSSFRTVFDLEYFLTLIGATEFVRYNPQRCFSMLGTSWAIPPLPCFSDLILPRLRDTPGDIIQVFYQAGTWDRKGRNRVLSAWENSNADHEAIPLATYDAWYEGVRPKLFIEFPSKRQTL